MSDGQEDKADAPQGYNNNDAAYKSESESDNINDGNAVTKGKANNQGQKSKSLYQARAQRQEAARNGNAAQPSRDEAREKMGYRAAAIRESRIKDRPVNKKASDSALKIKIELDLEVEVDLYARVKGDVTIGLM
ncbi:hypothetical protein V501_04100 [Pseudogymnoascus sp. VKM F-4519 (FW-2642)]|uniref:Uncharacterized protein n=1 Tax=Pseudogymnoascus verrucosus TaxID=342668 RepID=A0A1B8GMK9_9PEZI|nr:uncharacterized protein VE01_04816 [Pseudogymnoascus verrucosus]KFY79899.1 hypothetical protein V499_01157 [Pseudogymnoascus sp. VKM F-103]KFZ12658.1 hypothetical protein V501_04100 [Pseudogymnoascus sp. VKM F-4519 (FW-2642)]OBT97046.1 hypothetical protein VE01_04816 [Pseudogymnoascus verrucosus]